MTDIRVVPEVQLRTNISQVFSLGKNHGSFLEVIGRLSLFIDLLLSDGKLNEYFFLFFFFSHLFIFPAGDAVTCGHCETHIDVYRLSVSSQQLTLKVFFS